MDKKTMMERLARDAYEKGSFNGTWLYAENGEIVSKGAFGFRDAENKLPMQEDTIFEMASVTKMFTAAAVMLLVRESTSFTSMGSLVRVQLSPPFWRSDRRNIAGTDTLCH